MSEFKKIVEMMQAMRDGGKDFPEFNMISLEDRPVRLVLAGSKSKYPGSVRITDDRRYPDNVWYGSVTVDGRFFPNRDLTDEARRDVDGLLRLFAEDATAALKKFGKQTGCCGICGHELTAPESLRRYYGPTCAKKCGLPFDFTTYRRELRERRQAAENSVEVKRIEESEICGSCRDEIKGGCYRYDDDVFCSKPCLSERQEAKAKKKGVRLPF